jgi:hypothetical protein
VSKDTFFTSSDQRGINHNQSGACTVDNHHVELDLVIASLSTGPVGFGDGVGNTNRSLLMRCCAEDGKILAPSVAITPIDATWASKRTPPEVPYKVAARVWSSHTEVKTAAADGGSAFWYFVLAIDVPTSFPLIRSDLWPPIPSTLSVVYRPWHAPECTDGIKASDCGVVCVGLPDVRTGLPTSGSAQGTHHWELTTISHVLSTAGSATGIALIGEVAKVVSVSPTRFQEVSTTATGAVRVAVSGTPGELVELAFVVGVTGSNCGTIRTVTATIRDSGTASVTVSPAAIP